MCSGIWSNREIPGGGCDKKTKEGIPYGRQGLVTQSSWTEVRRETEGGRAGGRKGGRKGQRF
jgi:hypothetical protein